MYPEHPLYDVVRESMNKIENAPVIYLVGGPVRDILLYRSPKDIDFLVDGEMFPIVDVIADKLKAKVKKNKKLLTVSLKTKWGTVDFARARRETYEYPGALPKVESAANIREDLLRRDFTINALALPLLVSGWGDIVDITGGLQDLEDKLIRALHEKSFQDDPTRILRALRFQCRLGFTLEENTRDLKSRDWPFIKAVSPVRRLKEWNRICEEKDPAAIIDEIYITGGWEYFFAGMPYRGKASFTIGKIPEEIYSEKFRLWFYYLLLLLKQEPTRLKDIVDYWGLLKKDHYTLEQILLLAKNKGFVTMTKRQISGIMQKLPVEGIYFLYMELFSKDRNWLEFYEGIKLDYLPVNGHDLLQIGLKSNAEMGNILRILETYYREGRFDTKEEGIKLVLDLLKEDI